MFEGFFQRLRLYINIHQTLIEDSRNGVSKEGVDSPINRLRDAVRCFIGELCQGLKENSASSTLASCINDDVKVIATVLIFWCTDILIGRASYKGINHGSETKPQQRVSLICDIFRQTEGEIASIVVYDYYVYSCFIITLELWVVQINLEIMMCPASRIK